METIENVERLVYTGESDKKISDTTWRSERELANGETGYVYSGCIKAQGESFDMDSGFVTERKFALWIKAPSQESLDKNIKRIIKSIETGKRVPHVRYSTVPYYEGQEPDINMTTGDNMLSPEDLDPKFGAPNQPRYSRVSLTTRDLFDTLDKTYEIAEEVVQSEIETPVINNSVPNETT